MKARVIAFYLPQYYPTELNNKWYGEGFTEWTNVGKARPLFKGHYQPRVPKDLGYYDLRSNETRIRQAEMAFNAGIEGFCYYHYWFGKGREELDLPFKDVVQLGQPDFPFCICWANQSWYSKFWNNDIECEAKLIVEQNYDNEEWRQKHFCSLLDAFKDKRYITVDGKLLFMIYRPLEYSDVTIFMNHWQSLAKQYNLPGFYFVGQATSEIDAKEILSLGFDGVNLSRKDEHLSIYLSIALYKFKCKLLRALGGAPYHYDYRDIVHTLIHPHGLECGESVFPTIIPNWDHSPRSGKRGVIWTNTTPELFKLNVLDAIECVSHKNDDHKIVFLKSWNEWGEGNYVEPDLKYGHGYLDVLTSSLF